MAPILRWFVTAGPFLLLSATAQPRIITTYAGTDWIFQDNGRPALDTALARVQDCVVDRDGNLYVADPDNHLVVKITPAGLLTIAAGNGIRGGSGDGGPATGAQLFLPTGLAFDNDGNLHLTSGGLVQKVGQDGLIRRVAGGGVDDTGENIPALNASFRGIASDIVFDRAGNLYISETQGHRVRRVTPEGLIATFAGTGTAGSSGDGGPATQATLNSPTGLAIDTAGNLFIAQSNDTRIRKVTPEGVISTFVPFGGNTGRIPLIFDASGNLIVGLNQRIFRVDSSGTLTPIAGSTDPLAPAGDGGPALSASLFQVAGLAFDTLGNLFITEPPNFRIRKLAPNGIISRYAGNGKYRFAPDDQPALSSTFDNLSLVHADSFGNILFISNGSLRRVNSTGALSSVTAPLIPGGPAALLFREGAVANTVNFATASIASDGLGNLYLGAFRGAFIARVTPDGIIRRFAGTGEPGFSGDGGLALNARIEGPGAMVTDGSGNLYFFSVGGVFAGGGTRIRKVSPDGIITTIAGNGIRGYSGDGGPALEASIDGGGSIGIDQAGNIYFGEPTTHRIRRVGANGIITTVAGTGVEDFGNREGPALSTPISLRGVGGDFVFDAEGNLYFANRFGNTVRRISPNGTLTNFAGNGTSGFFGDGGPALNARLAEPSAVAIDPAGNLYIADLANGRIRVVLASAPVFRLSASGLAFEANAGARPQEPQVFAVTGSAPGLPFVLTVNGVPPWLRATVSRGIMPASVTVTADPAALQPGQYEATITITAANANPPSQTVTVRFVVGERLPARLLTRPRVLTFSFIQGSPASNEGLVVLNGGSGSADFVAEAATSFGGNWLRASPLAATADVTTGAALSVEADPAGLEIGTYSGRITVSRGGLDALEIPVTMTITPSRAKMLLSQSGLTATAVVGGGLAPPHNFAVLNVGRGAMTWRASVSTLAGGDWLTVAPGSGTSLAGSLQVPSVELRLNQARLAPGSYHGIVEIASPDADNSPQVVTVVFQVLPVGSNPGPVIQPSELVFTAVAGSSPSAREASVFNLAGRALTYASSAVSDVGAAWYQHVPTNATVTPDRPIRLVVQPDISGLTAGVRRGTLTLLFDDGSVRPVNLILVVTGSGPNALRPSADGCAPTRLIPAFQSLAEGFTVAAAWPYPIEVRVLDDCSTPMATGSVIASFSNGDPPLALSALKDGRWSGTWQALNRAGSRVAIRISAEMPGANLRGIAEVGGGLSANQEAPVVMPGGVPTISAPGGILSIFGARLADSAVTSGALPLPSQLGASSVSVAGRRLPLYFASPAQVNAQMSYDLTVNARHQVVVRRANTYAVPESVIVAPAQPSVFAAGGSQGLIFTQAGLADANNPARAGDTILIYAAGLGDVEPRVAAGAAAPLDTLSRVVLPVKVTIGGREAGVPFAGLAPGFAGVYQINAVLPEGVSAAEAVPVVIVTGGQTSPPATMAIR